MLVDLEPILLLEHMPQIFNLLFNAQVIILPGQE